MLRSQYKMQNEVYYKSARVLPKDTFHIITVCYVDSCRNFYVHLSDKKEKLEALMNAVKVHCENSKPPKELSVGDSCCAKYPIDGSWYRARMISMEIGKAVVEYVDYGNEFEVDVSDLRTITERLVKIPAAAMKCALQGFESMPYQMKTKTRLDMFTQDKTLMCHVVDILEDDTMLVNLVDETRVPPLDIEWKLNQLALFEQDVRDLVPSRQTVKFTLPEGYSDEVCQRCFRHERQFQARCKEQSGGGDALKERNPVRGKQEGARKKLLERLQHDKNKGGNREVVGSSQEEKCDERPKGDWRYWGFDDAFDQYKPVPETLELVPLDTPFDHPVIELHKTVDVLVSWVITPENFYVQLCYNQNDFQEMKGLIAKLYKGQKPYIGPVSVGSSVLARNPADNELYRAIVIDEKPGCSGIMVRFVDYGISKEVEEWWQLDRRIMSLPRLGVQCSLADVASPYFKWNLVPALQECFIAKRTMCLFQGRFNECYSVKLWCDDSDVSATLMEKWLADPLLDAGSLVDELDDMNILVGQQMICRVSYVQEYNRIFVNINLGKTSRIVTALETCDSYKLPLLKKMVPGTLCLVHYGEELVRAKLIYNEPFTRNHHLVRLLDIGVVSDMPREKELIIAIVLGANSESGTDIAHDVPAALGLCQEQAYMCIPHDYCESPTQKLFTRQQLQERLTGKLFIMYVNKQESGKLVISLFDLETGCKVRLCNVASDGYDSVSRLSSHPVYNYSYGPAYIAHVNSLDDVCLHRTIDAHRMRRLCDTINAFYQYEDQEPLKNVKRDTACVAKSSDGNWHRAIIVSVAGDRVKVLYCDYGKLEIVPKKSLKELPHQFAVMYSMALSVSLGLSSLRQNSIAKLREWTNGRSVEVTLSFSADDVGWHARLHLDGVDLAERIIAEQFAERMQHP